MHLFRRPQQLGCHYYERQGPVPGLVCRRFKLSCHQSSLPCPYLTRTCASVPADGPADEIVPSLAKDPNVEAEKKRALQYTNDSKKPNVHIGLHYELVKDEYGLPSHIHVLIGEEKHRWFKKIVYHTNHSNVERSLLNRENVQQTVRLLLAHAFQHSDPELTSLFTELY